MEEWEELHAPAERFTGVEADAHEVWEDLEQEQEAPGGRTASQAEQDEVGTASPPLNLPQAPVEAVQAPVQLSVEESATSPSLPATLPAPGTLPALPPTATPTPFSSGLGDPAAGAVAEEALPFAYEHLPSGAAALPLPQAMAREGGQLDVDAVLAGSVALALFLLALGSRYFLGAQPPGASAKGRLQQLQARVDSLRGLCSQAAGEDATVTRRLREEVDVVLGELSAVSPLPQDAGQVATLQRSLSDTARGLAAQAGAAAARGLDREHSTGEPLCGPGGRQVRPSGLPPVPSSGSIGMGDPTADPGSVDGTPSPLESASFTFTEDTAPPSTAATLRRRLSDSPGGPPAPPSGALSPLQGAVPDTTLQALRQAGLALVPDAARRGELEYSALLHGMLHRTVAAEQTRAAEAMHRENQEAADARSAAAAHLHRTLASDGVSAMQEVQAELERQARATTEARANDILAHHRDMAAFTSDRRRHFAMVLSLACMVVAVVGGGFLAAHRRWLQPCICSGGAAPSQGLAHGVVTAVLGRTCGWYTLYLAPPCLVSAVGGTTLLASLSFLLPAYILQWALYGLGSLLLLLPLVTALASHWPVVAVVGALPLLTLLLLRTCLPHTVPTKEHVVLALEGEVPAPRAVHVLDPREANRRLAWAECPWRWGSSALHLALAVLAAAVLHCVVLQGAKFGRSSGASWLPIGVVKCSADTLFGMLYQVTLLLGE